MANEPFEDFVPLPLRTGRLPFSLGDAAAVADLSSITLLSISGIWHRSDLLQSWTDVLSALPGVRDLRMSDSTGTPDICLVSALGADGDRESVLPKLERLWIASEAAKSGSGEKRLSLRNLVTMLDVRKERGVGLRELWVDKNVSFYRKGVQDALEEPRELVSRVQWKERESS
jgi:hypothetical protein